MFLINVLLEHNHEGGTLEDWMKQGSSYLTKSKKHNRQDFGEF
jgi:hypothetical protein